MKCPALSDRFFVISFNADRTTNNSRQNESLWRAQGECQWRTARL
jgi:hypothetical protein